MPAGEGHAAAASDLWLLAKNLPCLSDDVRRRPGRQEMTPTGQEKGREPSARKK